MTSVAGAVAERFPGIFGGEGTRLVYDDGRVQTVRVRGAGVADDLTAAARRELGQLSAEREASES